jgi:hypothetical protein
MAAVVFNAANFKARYPEFASVADAMLGDYFTEAGFYLSNADNSPVRNIDRRTVLLNMLTAHVAFLNGALSADGQPRPVGRVASAGEGSVSASFEYGTPGTHAWFIQSQYGAAFWQATTALRGFRYRSQPTRY